MEARTPGNRWIELCEFGQNVAADAIALKIEICIGGIFAPRDVVGGEPIANVLPAEFEEGTDDALSGGGPDAAEAGSAGAAEDAEEDGFGLIVEGVAGGDGVTDILRNAIEEVLVAETAGFLFGLPSPGG